LKDLGLFGLTIPTNYGGKGLTHLEFVRLCEETSANPAINTMLRAHQIEGVQVKVWECLKYNLPAFLGVALAEHLS